MKKIIIFILCLMCFKTCYSQISIVIDSIDLQFVSLRVQKKCKKNIPIEDMNSGPDITMFLSLVNISDTPVVIQNEKLDIGFSYIFMDSIFRFPQCQCLNMVDRFVTVFVTFFHIYFSISRAMMSCSFFG